MDCNISILFSIIGQAVQVEDIATTDNNHHYNHTITIVIIVTARVMIFIWDGSLLWIFHIRLWKITAIVNNNSSKKLGRKFRTKGTSKIIVIPSSNILLCHTITKNKIITENDSSSSNGSGDISIAF